MHVANVHLYMDVHVNACCFHTHSVAATGSSCGMGTAGGENMMCPPVTSYWEVHRSLLPFATWTTVSDLCSSSICWFVGYVFVDTQTMASDLDILCHLTKPVQCSIGNPILQVLAALHES